MSKSKKAAKKSHKPELNSVPEFFDPGANSTDAALAAPATRSKAISGTGTWRDGRSEKLVAEWTTWASTVFDRLQISTLCTLQDSPENRELLCELWGMGTKGFNERKLLKTLRAAYPLAVETAAVEPAAVAA